MNALKSMTKATARVRRDGAEAADPRGSGRRRRRDPARRRRRGAGRRADRLRELAADRRVRADRRERACVQGRDDARRRRARCRRPDEHGVHEHAGHARQRVDDRDRDGQRHAGRQDRRHARDHREGEDAADASARRADAVDRGRGGNHDGDHVRARPSSRPVDDGSVHHRGRARDRRDPGGDADRPADHPVGRRDHARQAQRDRQGPRIRRDARIDVGDQLRQDRHADDEPDDRRRGARSDRPLLDLRHRLRARRSRPARGRLVRHDRRRDPRRTSSRATRSS